MTLEFLKEPMEYVRPVLRETRQGEETAEAIIPDRCPDVTEVLLAEGTVMLRGREVTTGVANVSAGVTASVLVKPEGRPEPERVEVYIPLSFRVEHPEIAPGQTVTAEVQLRRLDGHMVNPRKVLVRATVTVTICVWEPCREEHPGELAMGQAELLRTKEPMRLLKAMGEKNYTAEDTVRLSAERVATELVSCNVKIRHNDTRLTGTRVVFRGDILLDAMYLDEKGSLCTDFGELPFSQYVDLGECNETDELSLNTCLTGADIALTADGTGLNCTLQLLTTGKVWENTELPYISDLYSLTGEAKPEWQTHTYESLLDRQLFAPVGRGGIQLGGSRVVRCCAIPGEMTHNRSGETMEFTLPVSVQVLTEEVGNLRSGSLRVNLSFSTQAASTCRFEACVEDIAAEAKVSGGRVDVTVKASIYLETYGSTEIREIVGAQVEETQPDKNRPGLIIRRTKSGESLWDIAKNYRTTCAAISEANGLAGDETGERLILIPLSGC